jgi:hypothetical protein
LGARKTLLLKFKNSKNRTTAQHVFFLEQRRKHLPEFCSAFPQRLLKTATGILEMRAARSQTSFMAVTLAAALAGRDEKRRELSIYQ